MEYFSWGQNSQIGHICIPVFVQNHYLKTSRTSTLLGSTANWSKGKQNRRFQREGENCISRSSLSGGSSIKKMYLKSKLSWNVVIPAESLDGGSLMLQKAIITRLMTDYAAKKASKDLGYFLALTTVENIGEGKVRKQSGDVIFPVNFSCITFKVLPGEILEGVVHKILKPGVFLKCGPVETVFLSHLMMDDYQFVPGENPYFMNGKSSKIEKGVVVRFLVIGEKFVEVEKDFRVVGSLAGDYLGPVSD